MGYYEDKKEQRIQIEVNDYIKIEILGYIKTPPGGSCESHKHPFWELVYSQKGEGIHRIGDCEITVKEGEICLISPEVPHMCVNEKQSENAKIYIGFSFHYSFYEKVIQDKQFILCDKMKTQDLKVQFNKLCDMFEKNELSIEKIKIGNIIGLLTQIVDQVSDVKMPIQNIQDIRHRNLVENVKSYLENNLCRKIKLNELSEGFYLSPHYIGDTFKKITGMSIKQYHEMLRMQYAYQLLEETDLSISEISDKLGFESIHYFSRRFKEYYTVSPSHLRK